MVFSWQCENPVFFDIETQSTVNLKIAGAKGYVNDPGTRLLSLVALDGDEAMVWVPENRGCPLTQFSDPRFRVRFSVGHPPASLAARVKSGRTFAAHNAAQFDAPFMDRLGVPIHSYYDTLPACRAAGLPGSLDKATRQLFGTGKHPGAAVIPAMTTARVRNGAVQYPVGSPHSWETLLRYNLEDVVLLRDLYAEVHTYPEPDVLEVDSLINATGVPIDFAFLTHLNRAWQEFEAEASVRLKDRGIENPRSVVEVRAALAKRGLRVESLNRNVVDQILEDPDSFLDVNADTELVIAILRDRQSATRTSRAKLTTLAQLADMDERLRDWAVYWGAHTGRWTGRGFQPHNLPRGVSCNLEILHDNPSLERVKSVAAENNFPVEDVFRSLVRSVVRSPEGLGIADYNAIEARCVAWIAGEQRLMDVFADPTQDPYCEMASRIFGRSVTKADEQLRFIGKNTVLGCGYSMSANKFAAMAKLQGVDLASAGTTAEECVDAYREAYPRIAGVRRGGFWQGGLWRAVGEAAYNAIDRGGSSEAGKCQFSKEGASLSIRLPSGRRLTYRGVRIEERVPGYCAMLGLPARPKKTIIYDHHHGYPKALYGGLLVENICQAICRDLLAGAMVRLNERIVLHVHDEIVIEGGDLKTLVETMSSPPDWAKGFTIVVEGFNSPVYGKSPPVGVRKLVARNGRVQ